MLFYLLVLTHGIPPDFRGGVYFFKPPYIRHRFSPEFFVGCDTQLRTDGVHSREYAETGLVILKVVPLSSAVFTGITMTAKK